jgi:hypothetical protein
MINGFQDFQKMNKENIDLAMKSVGAVTKGWQSIAVEVADYSKKNFEASTAAFEKVVAAKSIDKAFEAQADFARTAYEGYVSEVAKLGELYAGVAKEVYEPIETAVSKAAK